MLSWQVGDVRITRILELEATGGTRFILPQATREVVQEIDWLAPHFADENGRLKMSIHALVVETPSKRIIVDTCIGNDKQRDIPTWSGLQTNFLADLAAAGFPRESIDTVLCTHLHVDHVGWNTMLVDGAWVPTFPNARYLLGRAGSDDRWRREDEGNEAPRALALPRQRQARVGSGPGGPGGDRPRHLPGGLLRADARPHPGPRQRANPVCGRRRADHRRLHPPPTPVQPPGVGEPGRLRRGGLHRHATARCSGRWRARRRW